ncbi:glycosyltransferase [bacterium]|nr:glycosyltransferase [bacterium]
MTDKYALKICFFGIYDPAYSRNCALMRGFRENGFDVITCGVDPRKHGRVEKYFKLFQEYKTIKHEHFDYVVAAFPAHTVVWLARFLFGNKIIFDAFLSQYNTNVLDRRRYPKYSFRAAKDFLLDMTSCMLARTVLLDTKEHINYFTKTFGISKRKFIRVYVGTDDAVLYPVEKKPEAEIFIVHYHGSFIPVQGIEYILGAAKILSEDSSVKFRFFGKGQEHAKMRALAEELGLSNVVFYDPAPHAVLRGKMGEAGVCLGLFGTAARIDFSIPNKLFEAIACGKPVITARTKASLELFTDRENILFCERGDGKDLAEKILLLKNDPALRDKIAENAYRLFKERLTPKAIVGELLRDYHSKR